MTVELKSVLVIAAHPDDEVLGCGATIARLSREGHDLNIAILGEGITSRYEPRERADTSLVDDLHARSRKVGNLLGAKGVFTHTCPIIGSIQWLCWISSK